MTKIILLLILFNLATAYFKNRAKKQREAAARNGEEEIAQDWDERNTDIDDAEKAVNPYREQSARAKPVLDPQSPGPRDRSSKDVSGLGGDRSSGASAPKEKGRAAEVGKDILSQLAKELGLELPERPQPRPTPSPAPISRPVGPAAPPAAASPAFPNRNQRVTSADDDQVRTVPDSKAGADLTSAPGIAAVESANAAAYAARDPLRATALTALRADLLEPESLRRAFILKTVLDKPLSLRTQSPGPSASE